MITSKQCWSRYGDPALEKSMVLWDVPTNLEIGVLPNRIYCNKDLIGPLTKAFIRVIERGLVEEVKTWDGCFNIRSKKGSFYASLHSWGLAVDINAAWNGFGKRPTMSPELVKCFIDSGFDWGGKWKIPDGMHFQLAVFPLPN